MNKTSLVVSFLLILFISLSLSIYLTKKNRRTTTKKSDFEVVDRQRSASSTQISKVADKHVETVAETETHNNGTRPEISSQIQDRSAERPARPRQKQERQETATRAYLKKSQEVAQLSNNLPSDGINQLLESLDRISDEQKGLTKVQDNAIKNEILDKLITQDKLPRGLGLYLVQMYRDPAHCDLWRNYCVQHFQLYYERRWSDSEPSQDDPEFVAIQEAYWDAVEETESSIAGSALLGLERLSNDSQFFDRERLKYKVMEFAANQSTPLQTRITAISLCGKTDQTGILPEARALARNSKSIPLRIASIATIGELGNQQDIVVLKRIAASSNRYVSKAARSALARIRKQSEAGS